MLFNLSQCLHFPSKGESCWEIVFSSKWGPQFTGFKKSALSAFSDPFNGEGNCISLANLSGYGIPIDSASKNMLTNKDDGNFTITELELWEVMYI